MSEETLNLEKLSLEDVTVEINEENEKFGVTTSSRINRRSKCRKRYKLLLVPEEYNPQGTGSDKYEELQATGRTKRKHEAEETSEEQMEEMARLVIEDSMTLALIRRCWKCGQSFVKEGQCTAVRCVCGATTCYSCGHFIANNLVTAHLGCAPSTTPGEDWERVRRAAARARRALRANHPSLTFKYDPSGCDDYER